MNRPILLAIAAAIIVAIATFFLLEPRDLPPAPDQEATIVGPDLVAPPLEALPSLTFDIIRVSREGTAVIAGRAEPNQTLDILDGETVIGTVTADDEGAWVFILDEPLDPGSRELSLETKDAAGNVRQSSDIVVVRVPAPDEDRDAIAVLTPRDGTGPSRVLQGLAGQDQEIGVGSVDYDDDGQVMISGWARPDMRVLAYLDNSIIGSTETDEQGFWEITADRNVPPGIYTLRVDQVNEHDQVASRVELPFERAPIADLSALDIGQAIVQPGNSLWRIARRIYGKGARYTLIYEANDNQIRDPDLIYPGQVFTIPNLDESMEPDGGN